MPHILCNLISHGICIPFFSILQTIRKKPMVSPSLSGNNFASGSFLSAGSCLQMKLWIVHNTVGIFAWILRSYSSARRRMRKRHFKTPKMCLMTFHAEAWQRLNGSFFILWPIVILNQVSHYEWHKYLPGVCITPFSKMIMYILIRNKEVGTEWITCISKVILASGNMQVVCLSIFVDTSSVAKPSHPVVA